MSSRHAFLFAVMALLVAAGCNGSGTSAAAPAKPVPPPSAPAAPAEDDGPTKAQPRLQTLNLWLGAEELVTELALSQEEQMTGMMFRESMPENEGMLFVFGAPHQASFWMKNTTVHLSAAYIDSEGVILEIRELKPKDTTPVRAKTDKVQYVLEVNYGWFERHNLKEGMLVRTERGTLRETFFGK